jgi:hypothetical protein
MDNIKNKDDDAAKSDEEEGDAETIPMLAGDYKIHIYIEKVKNIKLDHDPNGQIDALWKFVCNE